MSVYTNLHFCLIGIKQPAAVKARAHPNLADTIEVTVRVGDASFSVSGPTAAVRGLLTEMHAVALRIVPLAAEAADTETQP